MTYVYPNTISTFSGDESIAIASGYVKVEDSVYADLVETKKMWVDGEIVEDPTYPERKQAQDEEEERQARAKEIADEVALLKQNLLNTDYCIIKISEGVASRDDYAEVIEQRAAWRERINELEN